MSHLSAFCIKLIVVACEAVGGFSLTLQRSGQDQLCVWAALGGGGGTGAAVPLGAERESCPASSCAAFVRGLLQRGLFGVFVSCARRILVPGLGVGLLSNFTFWQHAAVRVL